MNTKKDEFDMRIVLLRSSKGKKGWNKDRSYNHPCDRCCSPVDMAEIHAFVLRALALGMVRVQRLQVF